MKLDALKKAHLVPRRTPWWVRRKPFRHWVRTLLNAWYWTSDCTKILALRVTGQGTVLTWSNREHLSGSKFVIFATYPTGAPLPCHQRLLRAFESRGYRIILATNHPRGTEALESYNPQWSRLVRRPLGRDFGCYRDACLELLRETEQAATPVCRVVLLNDSIVTLGSSESVIVEHLDNEDSEFAGLTENFEIGYHVGSFALAMGKMAFNHPEIRDFWKTYLPVSSRYHSIHYGEMGLTSRLCKAGFAPTILHDLTSMKRQLVEKDLWQLRDLSRRLPSRFDVQARMLLSEIDRTLDDSDLSPGSACHDDLKDRLVHQILSFVFRASPIHLGATIIASSTAAFLKKDIVWRQAIYPWDLRDLILEANPSIETAELGEIYREIMARGHPYTLSFWNSILYDLSII